MGLYRARDLLLAPSLISLTRIPLAAAFVVAVEHPPIAFVVLCISGFSDVLDGWIARTQGLATATGAVVDPITDKLFVLTVMVTLVLTGRLPPISVLLLSTREIGEAPLVLFWMFNHASRKKKAASPRANVPGKIATAMQFLAVALGLFGSHWARPAMFAAAGAGTVAASEYWLRELALTSSREAPER
jgi:CDP-diacylglycerol--glycerol-3-phosphate 3-phosphatidyltransferase/cardiolipin synthase